MTHFIKYFPAVLCLVIALIHPFWVKHFHADPWKLGGFRMFSQASENYLVFYGTTKNGQIHPITINEKALNHRIDDVNSLEILRAESLPSPHRLKTLMEGMSEMKVVKVPDGFKLVSKGDILLDFQDQFISIIPSQPWKVKNVFKELGVIVWSLEFFPSARQLNYVKKTSATYKL